MVLWIRFRMTGLSKPLAAELGGEEDLRHPAVGDAFDDLVATVLRHSERTNLAFLHALCPPGLTPTATDVPHSMARSGARRLGISDPKRRSGRLQSILPRASG